MRAIALDVKAVELEPRPVVITMNPASKMLRIGTRNVYGLITAAELEAVHIGRSAPMSTRSIDGLGSRLSNAGDRRR
jgi:hypothetical protein